MFDEAQRIKIIGYVLVIYGILKVSFCITLVSLPDKYRKGISILTRDATTAGSVLDLVLFIFGSYTILHGLAMIGNLHTTHSEFLNHIYTIIGLYSFLGVFLIVFYSLVVYTNIPISKEENEMGTYELVGIGGGIGFLLVLAIMMLWSIYYGKSWTDPVRFSGDTTFLAISSIALIASFAWLIYNVVKRKGKQPGRNEIVTLAMLPLGAMN